MNKYVVTWFRGVSLLRLTVYAANEAAAVSGAARIIGRDPRPFRILSVARAE